MIGILLLFSHQVEAITEEEEMALIERFQTVRLGDPLAEPQRRVLRVLVAYNQTDYFIDEQGRKRGFDFEVLERFEKFLNKGKKRASERIEFAYYPMQFSKIINALAEGRGDIAAAGLTVTPERSAIVDFADPYLPEVHEILVTHDTVKGIDQVENLAGREIAVAYGTSYMEHLRLLSDNFVKRGLKPIKIIEVDEDLDPEDLLELVNSGAIKMTIIDDYRAELWSKVLTHIVPRTDIMTNEGGKIAWAVRKDAPKLKEQANQFVKTFKQGTLLGNVLFKRYFKGARWVKNPLGETEFRKLDKVMGLMKKYAERYGWDWIAVAAQAYQESGLDQEKLSPAGAIGIMQLLPSTAEGNPINIKNIKDLEENIHAGVKYLAFVRKHYFSDPAIAPEDRIDFSWAAYNAGPNRIQRLRKIAKKRGYDPNVWFNNVEHIAAEVISAEPVRYVSNINKYYVAYKIGLKSWERRKSALEKH
jgi:membrane-bound lytic murein transglycosylase MltF